MNPFDGGFDRIGHCRDGAACQYSAETFLRFTNAPEVPPVDDVRGSVILVGGSPGHGKSVYGHRLLHEYHARRLRSVDLMGAGPYEECLARRQDVLLKLRASLRTLDDGDLADTQINNSGWATGLRTLMSNEGKGMVVRLPCTMRNVNDDKVAWEICQYANAAEMSDSVFIYEYRARDWPADWDRLCEDLDTNVSVHTRVVDPVAPAELWDYVKDVMRRSPHPEITFEAGVPELVMYVFGRDAMDPRRVHGMMRRIFAGAIKEGGRKVTFDLLWPEAERLGSRAT
ncbi:hypothetical protein [Actinomadura decatromicini]|uniref:Uncharacterized protein n=1 Tax=Actinomadura decatromicini TaxID=2604572 RepID=A0A5D3FUJ0_9ACTN|nr:hypothetical protein [Actinomadura decatromicini]TYK52527.1 hypothetical protein FXF68_01770 [Actinomadura decatromicini]